MTAIQPASMRDELTAVIATAITQHPRSLQQQIGPSEIGTPCARRLGHKLAGTPAAREQSPAWRPTVGVATHEWLADTFRADNARYTPDERWLVETSVWVGDVDGVMITGSADLYDARMQWVIDWKIVGPGSLKKYRAAVNRGDCPSEQYRTQLHLYGRGFTQLGAGLPVDRVAIVFLPSAGELTDAVVWDERYDEQVALDALARADGIAAGLRLVGPDAILPQLATSDAHCAHCPWMKPGATDLARECPGDAALYPKPLAMTDLVTAATASAGR